MPHPMRIDCKDCACFEPMAKQSSNRTTIGSCHLDPPSERKGDGLSHWPVVIKEYGFCFSGVKKDGK